MRAVAVNPERRSLDIVEHDEPELASATDVRLRMLEVGVCGTGREKAPIEVDTDRLMGNLVLRNQVVLGSVNAGKGAFDMATPGS